MKKPRRKLTKAERKAKALRRAMFMTIFINGKQKRVRRPELIDGLTPEEFIMENADPIWLHQNEMWEYMTPEPAADRRHGEARGSGYDRCMADEKQPEPSSPAKDGSPSASKNRQPIR